jgi:histidinol-phosphate/aromatic aminotransferase/cobyric acid decarboxylase-like protein
LLAEKPLPNVLVLRSLSKSLGVPGLRLGYAYCHNENFNTWLNNQIPVWNLNSMAEHFLEIILKHRKSLADSIEMTKADRAQFISGLRQIGRFERVSDSQGNFVMVSLSEKTAAQELVEYLLKEENIFIKNLSAKYTVPQGFLRFAVRTPAENTRLVDAIRRMPSRA